MVEPEPALTPVTAAGAPASTPVAVAAVGTSAELVREFAAGQVTGVRHAVRQHAGAAGLGGDALFDFVTAVHELVANAVRHGGGRGRLRLRRDGDTLICDVTDRGEGFTRGVQMGGAMPPTDVSGGRGILLARELTDTLLISDGPSGVTATVTVCIPVQGSTPGPSPSDDHP